MKAEALNSAPNSYYDPSEPSESPDELFSVTLGGEGASLEVQSDFINSPFAELPLDAMSGWACNSDQGKSGPTCPGDDVLDCM